jgi:hypothetical protein
MYSKTIILLLLANIFTGCWLSVNNKQEQINNDMTNQSIVFNIHTSDEKVSKLPPTEKTDSIVSKVLELFSEAEPTRRVFEENELEELLQNSEGFDIFFDPPLFLDGSENKLSKLHFFTRGELANNPESEDIFFIAALDGEFLNHPLIAYQSELIYSYLSSIVFE